MAGYIQGNKSEKEKREVLKGQKTKILFSLFLFFKLFKWDYTLTDRKYYDIL